MSPTTPQATPGAAPQTRNRAPTELTASSPRKSDKGQISGSDRKLGLGLALLGVLLFSFKGIYIKYAYHYGVDALTLLTLRMIISLPVYVLIGLVIFRQKVSLGKTPTLRFKILAATATCGFLGYYLASWLDLEALKFISVQLERLILFAYPSFVVLLSIFLLKEMVSPTTVAALIVSYIGIILVVMHDMQTGPHVLMGSLLVGTSSFAFAIYMLLAKPIIGKLGSGLFTAIAMSFSSLFVFIHFFLIHGGFDKLLTQPMPVYYWAFILAIAGTVLPSFMISQAIAMIGSVKTSIAGSTGPVLTAILAVMLLGEAFTVFHLFGLLLVIGGMTLLAKAK